MIEILIDKLDTFEIVRDLVALRLAEESVQQQNMAKRLRRDPELWAMDVYTERSTPWDFLHDTDRPITPIVNVWFDCANIDARASQSIDRQQFDVSINIDIYAGAVAELTADGHKPSDESAVRKAQATARLVRNILMHDSMLTLGVDRGLGLIGGRMITNIQSFQPPGEQPAVGVAAMRLTLSVRVSEITTGTAPQVLEQINTIARSPSGRIIFETEMRIQDVHQHSD